MPDVKVENGKVILPDESAVDETTKRNVEIAMDSSCKPIRDKLPASAIGDAKRDGPRPEDVPKLREFAKCMRDNGVPDFPDPKADGTFPIANTPYEALSNLSPEHPSPAVADADHACRQYSQDWDIRAS
jgi:hypothetical protein